jgi:hypothetical protein
LPVVPICRTLRHRALLRLPFFAPGRPFNWLRHSAQLSLKLRYRQILAGQPSIEADVQHVLVERRGIAADSDQ